MPEEAGKTRCISGLGYFLRFVSALSNENNDERFVIDVSVETLIKNFFLPKIGSFSFG